MKRQPPGSTRTDTLCPYPARFRSSDSRAASALAMTAPSEPDLVPPDRRSYYDRLPGATDRSRRRSRPSRGSPSASGARSEEHKYEIQSLMRTSYAVLCLNNKHLNNSIKLTKTQKTP